jgi:lipoprotein-anchoring transpeptidase ErfK/SrfK
MATEDQVEEKIMVKEEQDGSVTVDLPDSIPSPDQDDGTEEARAEGGAAADEDDQDRDDDTEAIRAARRNRRKAKKEYIKKTNEEKDQRLVMLQRQNQELMERLSNVERKTHSADLARIDKAIEDKELRLQYARMKMSEATSAGDGEAFAKAQEMWYETRREVESIKALKENAVRSANVQSPANSAELQRHANRWMEKNDWFNPEGGDEDSEIAKVIDQKLVQDGWNPTSNEYWQELDKRLQKRLPHRYTDNYDDDGRSSRRPRSIVTSSGREGTTASGMRNSFTLSPEQVRAIKDAGMWDNPQSRNRMIKRYAEQARSQNSGYRS